MKQRTGFSLLEVTLALGILTVALLATLQVFLSGSQMVAQSTQVTTAGELARELLDRCAAIGYALVPPNSTVFDGTATTPTLPDANGFPPAPYPEAVVEGTTYRFRVTTDNLAVLGATNEPRAIFVEVFWGRNHQASFETYLHP